MLTCLSAVDRFSLANPRAELGPQGRVLADLLTRMAPAEIMASPQWVFDRDCADSKIMEDVRLSLIQSSYDCSFIHSYLPT